MQANRVTIRPQMRGPMLGALVKESGVIRELPVELPDAARLLNRIGNVARQMAAILVTRGYSITEANAHARAIEDDLALLREML